MRTYVTPGKAIIQGYLYENTSNLYLEHALPEPTLDRIDRIVLRLDKRNQSRYIRLFVKQGTPDENPVPPDLQRDDFIYELSLAQIRVRANTSTLNPADLIDERLDENLCGLVHSLISIPTSQFQAQWDLYFNAKKDEIDAETLAYEQELANKLIQYENDFNAWFADIQDTGFASSTDFNAHKADTTKHITAEERIAWNSAEQNAKNFVLQAKPNLLKNSAFQFGLAGWQALAGAPFGAGSSITRGTFAMYVNSVPAGSWAVLESNQRIGFAGSLQVTLSADFYTLGITSGKVFLEINSNGTPVVVGQLVADLNKDWHRKSATFTLPSNATEIWLRFVIGDTQSTTPAGTKAVTRIKLEYGTQATPYSEEANFLYVRDGKLNVRNAITNKGGTVADADGDGIPTFDELVSGIDNIPSGMTISDGYPSMLFITNYSRFISKDGTKILEFDVTWPTKTLTKRVYNTNYTLLSTTSITIPCDSTNSGVYYCNGMIGVATVVGGQYKFKIYDENFNFIRDVPITYDMYNSGGYVDKLAFNSQGYVASMNPNTSPYTYLVDASGNLLKSHLFSNNVFYDNLFFISDEHILYLSWANAGSTHSTSLLYKNGSSWTMNEGTGPIFDMMRSLIKHIIRNQAKIIVE